MIKQTLITAVMVLSGFYTGLVSGEVSVEKDKAIRQLVQIVQIDLMREQMIDQMLDQFKAVYPQVPQSFWEEQIAALNKEKGEFVDRIVPVYSKNFTMEEISALTRFYSTPVGKKVIEKMPSVTQESGMILSQWGQSKAASMMQKLAVKGYKPEQGTGSY